MMKDLENLKNLVLAPYIMQATKLIWVERKVGGNQFRHCWYTLGILIDYKYFTDPVLLKAALLHDLAEDLPDTDLDAIRQIDDDGREVVDLILELTRKPSEIKEDYLQRLLDHGSDRALLIKAADRVSNLVDMHLDTHSNEKIGSYLDQTERYIVPMARKVNQDMVLELTDLIKKRRMIIEALK